MNSKKQAFTLIELLIVLAIVGILAAMATYALSGSIEKAQDEKCRTNLKQLSTACISYANDHGGDFPRAQSFEIFNSRTQRYEERRGWIAWVPSDRDIDTLNSHWDGKQGEKSQSNKLKHDRGHGEDARFGVEYGTIFEYMNKSFEHYVCPASTEISHLEKGVPEDEEIFRTYAMNEFFYAPHYPSPWHCRKMTRIGTDESFPYGDADKKKTFIPEASKLLLFSEIIVPNNKSDKGEFNPGRKMDKCCRHGDSILVAWEKENIDVDRTDVIMPIHQRKQQGELNSDEKINFGFSFVIFADGHIDSVQQSFLIGEKRYNTLWFLLRGIDPKNTNALGEGLN